MVHIGNDWDEILADEWEKPYYLKLRQFLKSEYSSKQIYPNMNDIFNAIRRENSWDTVVYEVCKELGTMSYLLPPAVFADKDKYEAVLYELFKLIITAGIQCYNMASRYDTTLNATNYLKKDKNYYFILNDNWPILSTGIHNILSTVM